MKSTKPSSRAAILAAPLFLATVSFTPRSFHHAESDAVTAAANDIGGVVTGPSGPEAGVWVIAETTELPTSFVSIVVTDDRGAI